MLLNKNRIFKTIIIINLSSFLLACNNSTGSETTNPPLSCKIVGINESVETAYSFTANRSQESAGEYADNPVRPFLVKQNESYIVNWFASNSKGYCKSYGLPVSQDVPDILAQIRYSIDSSTGACNSWVVSRFNDTPNEFSVSSYYNEFWMVVPYTFDGINFMALIHNEYHIVPSDVTNVYGNLIGATSNNNAESFNLYQINESNNYPVIVAPYPYNNTGKGGMFAQTNIIKWGSYYYMLVNQVLTPINESAPSSLCIYRTNNINQFNSWRGWNESTTEYDVPLVESYPSNLSNPEQYYCSPIPNLPSYFHYSWSYNVKLHAFMLIGLDESYNNNSAFVYTLASLNPNTGVLTPYESTTYNVGFLRYINSVESWMVSESISAGYYPSILDPNSPQLSDNTASVPVEQGDLNFQYSGESVYLYYTRFNPKTIDNRDGQNRDIVRQLININCE